MKIYTKTGDKGETSLFGGKRVPKYHLRIETFGTLDELNCVLGIVRSLKPVKEIGVILEQLQRDLFVLGSDLATPISKHQPVKAQRILENHVTYIEHTIDHIEEKLQPLHSFILPGGTPIAAHLHTARAVCRRAERFVTRLGKKENIGMLPTIYLNRFSDLLFILARYANTVSGEKEILWNPPKT